MHDAIQLEWREEAKSIQKPPPAIILIFFELCFASFKKKGLGQSVGSSGCQTPEGVWKTTESQQATRTVRAVTVTAQQLDR